MWLLALAEAVAAPDRVLTLAGGLAASAGPAVGPGASAGGSALGRVILRPEHTRFAVEIGAREGYFANDGRSVGAIQVDLRYDPDGLGYLRGGFLHHHEVGYQALLANPVGSVLGSGPDIRHRTGLELAVGLADVVDGGVLDHRLGAFADLGVSLLPDALGPVVYGTLELGFTVGVGRDRGAPVD